MWEGIKLFIATWHAPCEFIIVDDGSSDDTAKLIKANDMFCKLVADGRAQLIQQKNTGKGGALANGVAQAKYNFILTLDADMATMPTELLKWLQYEPGMFDTYSVYIAARTHKYSELVLISSRRESGKLFAQIVQKLIGLPYTDTQCGFKLYPSLIAKGIFSKLYIKGWAHDVDLLLQLQRAKISVVEMPIAWNEREASKINVITDGIKMLYDVLKLRIFRKSGH
ncbi:MAG: hypothetical protein RL660_265 [Bacteroidota bacterium]|jgi:dolichyl-phosphate beta-glucosyltransferase